MTVDSNNISANIKKCYASVKSTDFVQKMRTKEKVFYFEKITQLICFSNKTYLKKSHKKQANNHLYQ